MAPKTRSKQAAGVRQVGGKSKRATTVLHDSPPPSPPRQPSPQPLLPEGSRNWRNKLKVSERGVDYDSLSAESQFLEDIIDRYGWRQWLTKPSSTSIRPQLVQHFHDLRVINRRDKNRPRVVRIHGVDVHYGPKEIAEVCGIPHDPSAPTVLKYSRRYLVRMLCLEGVRGEEAWMAPGPSIRNETLNWQARALKTLMLSHIIPYQHMSAINEKRGMIMCAMLRGREPLLIACILSLELHTTEVYGFPVLITRLCERDGVPLDLYTY